MDHSAFDQVLAGARDSLPRIWYAYYIGCLQAGFNEQQAFSLVQTVILCGNSAGIRPSPASPDTLKEEDG